MHVETELLKSEPLSRGISGNCSVWLKLETQQISGSFKYRGISLLCKKSVEENGCKKFVCSSGGNAGLAATVAAGKLGTPITVYVPNSTPQVIRDKLENHGAKVEVHGNIWDQANIKALEAAKEDGVAFIHPFDNPIIWEGHSSIITELHSQLNNTVPDVVIASVGGGGLMNGILLGMRRVGWSQVPFVAMETVGADSLNACVRAGEWVELEDITSVAKCLGARKVSQRSYEHLCNDSNVYSCTVSDDEALRACITMADQHGIHIPPACGAAVAAVTSNTVLVQLQEKGKIPDILDNVVVIVCGGSGVDKQRIEEWRVLLNEKI